MSLPVIIMPEAEQNLWDTAQWWAENRFLAQAERWYDGFVDALESLPHRFERCPLAREDGDFPYELRELHYGVGARPTHRALFTLRPDAIVVLSIRHGAQQDVTPEDLPPA